MVEGFHKGMGRQLMKAFNNKSSYSISAFIDIQLISFRIKEVSIVICFERFPFNITIFTLQCLFHEWNVFSFVMPKGVIRSAAPQLIMEQR